MAGDGLELGGQRRSHLARALPNGRGEMSSDRLAAGAAGFPFNEQAGRFGPSEQTWGRKEDGGSRFFYLRVIDNVEIGHQKTPLAVLVNNNSAIDRTFAIVPTTPEGQSYDFGKKSLGGGTFWFALLTSELTRPFFARCGARKRLGCALFTRARCRGKFTCGRELEGFACPSPLSDAPLCAPAVPGMELTP